MNIILIEDHRVTRLYPATIGRPAFDVACGSYCLLDLLRRLGHPIRAFVRPHLQSLLRADSPELAEERSVEKEPVLLVNARLVPSVAALSQLKRLIAEGRPGVVRADDGVAAALTGPEHRLPTAEDLSGRDMAEWLEPLRLPPVDVKLPLFQYPHDLVRYHTAILAENLDDRIASGNYREIRDGLFAAEGATLGEHVVLDTSNGPVLLDEQSSIGPYCYLSGPAYIGARARVIEHSAIKDGVSLGHTTKVGGEVEASIIEPYTNKQHHGFIGHSYLGRWINLGAGTSNSDLKNTYGQVSMEYDGHRVATGMQFLGCIIGDYAKTAVNTSIFTGKTIGACTMVYGFVTTNVPSFVNYARLFGQVTETTVDVMVATQERMFARRNVEQRPADANLLADMYELTRHERQMAVEPLSL